MLSRSFKDKVDHSQYRLKDWGQHACVWFCLSFFAILGLMCWSRIRKHCTAQLVWVSRRCLDSVKPITACHEQQAHDIETLQALISPFDASSALRRNNISENSELLLRGSPECQNQSQPNIVKHIQTPIPYLFDPLNLEFELNILCLLHCLGVKRPQLLMALLKEPTPLSPATLDQCPSTSVRTKDAYDEKSHTRACTQRLHTERGSLACVTCSWWAAGGRNRRSMELMMVVQMSCTGSNMSFCFRHSLSFDPLYLFYSWQMHKHKNPFSHQKILYCGS